MIIENSAVVDIIVKHGFTAFALYLMYLIMRNELHKLTEAIQELKEEIKILRQVVIGKYGDRCGN